MACIIITLTYEYLLAFDSFFSTKTVALPPGRAERLEYTGLSSAFLSKEFTFTTLSPVSLKHREIATRRSRTYVPPRTSLAKPARSTAHGHQILLLFDVVSFVSTLVVQLGDLEGSWLGFVLGSWCQAAKKLMKVCVL